MWACLDSPGPVHHAAHDRHPQLLDAGPLLPPQRHPLAQVVLDLLRHLLEEGAGGAAAAGAGGDLRGEAPETERLEDLLRHLHLFGPVAAGRRRQGHADGVADALLQQDAEPRRAGDDPLGAEPGLGQPEVERVVAAGREHAVDVHQVLHAGDLGAEDDPVVRKPAASASAAERSALSTIASMRHRAGVPRLGRAGVRVHHLGQQLLVERAPVDADPHRLLVAQGHLDDGAEVLVGALAADVARIDAILGQRAGAVGIAAEQQMAVVVEVADDRDADADPVQLLDDRRGRRPRPPRCSR